MNIIRTLGWVILTALLVVFIAMNWVKTSVNIWPQENGFLYLEWPVGLIALLFFIAGLLPMWLYHRTVRWTLHRRITTLEASLREANAATVKATAANAKPAPAILPPTLPSSSDSSMAIPANEPEGSNA